MTRPARFSPRAVDDLREATAWIARDNPAAARRLRTVVRQTALRIARYPRSAPLRPDLVPLPTRVLALPGWPYLLLYQDTAGGPLILRVIHAARDVPDTLSRDLPG